MKNNINNLRRGLMNHIQKSYVEGIYSDNSTNRKLGRVGMKYGINIEGFEKEEDKGDTYATDPKLVLKRAKDILGERSFKLLKDIIEKDDNYKEGNIYEYKGKIHFSVPSEVNPEQNKDIVNLGKETGGTKGDLDKYYQFIKETWSPQQLEDKWLNTFEKEESWGNTKYFSMLFRLQNENQQREWVLDDAKSKIWWKRYDKGEVAFDSDYREISDEEAEKYIKIHGSKTDKEILSYNSKHTALFKALYKYGIDFYNTDINEIDKYKDDFKRFIETCPKNDFYQIVKECAEDHSYFESLIKLRFAFKYNKMIAGSGWEDIMKEGKDKKSILDVKKRDEVLELCKQIEYAVDDVLGEDKGLFINNPNIEFIRFDKGTDWGGASYSGKNKTITITSEYFHKVKENRRLDKRASTLSREKFMVEGFIHEIGHSLDTTPDIYNSAAYKDFARHLGYDKYQQYTIYTNALKQDADLFEGQDYYLSIEKDKKDELIKRFKPLYEAYFGGINTFSNRELADIFISGYSSKSAGEGFAEYFSFYMGNKKVIDKAIKDYEQNPTKYLEGAKIKDWYKYSVYGGKWEEWFDRIPEKYKDSEGTKKLKKYNQEVIKHNLEMFKDIQSIVKNVEKKLGIVKK